MTTKVGVKGASKQRLTRNRIIMALQYECSIFTIGEYGEARNILLNCSKL